MRDPCVTMWIDPHKQIESLKKGLQFEVFLSCYHLVTTQPNGGIRLVEMEGVDLEMINMGLARIRVNMVNEAARPKLLRYQQECAKVLSDYWSDIVASSSRPWCLSPDEGNKRGVCDVQ